LYKKGDEKKTAAAEEDVKKRGVEVPHWEYTKGTNNEKQGRQMN
jgi:hypothetical protein